MTIALSAVLAVVFIAIAWKAPPVVTGLVGVVWVLIGRTFTTPVVLDHALLPRPADFSDFLLVPLAFAAAVVRAQGSLSERLAAVWRASAGLLVAGCLLLLVCLASTAVNGLGLLRALADWLFLVEPFMLLAVFLIAPPSVQLRRRIAWVLVVVVGLEFAAMTAQVLRSDVFGPVAGFPVREDYVTGTMFGSLVGQHVLPAVVFLLSLFIASLTELRKTLRLGVVVLSVAFLVLADDKQMLLVSPVALLLYGVSRAALTGGGISRRTAALVALGATAVLGVATAYIMTFGNGYGATLLSRTVEGGGKVQVDRHVIDSTFGSVGSSILGMGPGDTVSRLADLTLPVHHRSGSPVSDLHIHPTADALRYQSIAAQAANGADSDLLAPTSSFFGLLGDLGLAGVVAYLGLWWATQRRLFAVASPFRPVAVAGWVALVPLGVVFDWFEQPAFTLTLALVTGLAASDGQSTAAIAVFPSRGAERAYSHR